MLWCGQRFSEESPKPRLHPAREPRQAEKSVTIECPHCVQRYVGPCTVNNSLLSRHPVQSNPATTKKVLIERFAAGQPKDRSARTQPGKNPAKFHIGGDTPGTLEIDRSPAEGAGAFRPLNTFLDRNGFGHGHSPTPEP